MPKKNKKILVLFSGGQDSTLCLAYALTHYDTVETLGFDYGQIHKIEMQCRLTILQSIREKFPLWRQHLGQDHTINARNFGEIGQSALTKTSVRLQERKNADAPNSFVPGRNVLFFTLAAALAYERDITHLMGGMCETDYSGYPDCRRGTLDMLEKTLRLGMEKDFTILTPLMQYDKAKSWQLAQQLGGQRLRTLIIEQTHSCYRGCRKTLHPWGYGCAACEACRLRARGFEKYQALVHDKNHQQ